MRITNAADISGIPPREQKDSEQQTLSSELEEQEEKLNISMAIADKVIMGEKIH